MMTMRKPGGPTFWVAVGLALVVGIVSVVEFGEFGAHLAWSLACIFWNCVPVLAALGLVFAARHSGPTMRFAGYGFSVGASGVVLLGHILWAFDIGKMATGSSTAGLIFIFLPGWEVIVGAFAAVLGGSLGFAWGRRTHPAEVERP